MEIAIKLADARLPTHLAYEKNWLDGQPIEARWDGFNWGTQDRKNFLILRTIDDFWTVRGGTDWKVWNQQAEDFTKLFHAKDSNEKYKWEFGYLKDEKRIRMRDRFLNINDLLVSGLISKEYYDKLYAHGVKTEILNLNASLFNILKYEGIDTRPVLIKNQGITSGTYSIGSGLNYATIALFATDVNAGEQMDGDLTGEHNAEETGIAADVTFDTDTNSYLLKLTAQSGDEHTGAIYGNGARATFTAGAELIFDETDAGDLADIEISNLAFNLANNTIGVKLFDCGVVLGGAKVNRMLFAGGYLNDYGIDCSAGAFNVTITNNIVYDLEETAYTFNTSDRDYFVANNGAFKCKLGFFQDHPTTASGLTFENNIAQGNTTDYLDDGAGWGTGSYNISEDATGPNAAYDNTDVNTNSVFLDYANDDYRLDSEGDATNLAIMDDGANLYGDGVTEDIQGQARDDGTPFWIGASHIAGGETIDFLSTVALVTVFGAVDLDKLLSFLSASSSVTVVTAVDMNVSRLLLSTSNAVSTLSSIDLDKLLNFLSTISGQTVLSSIDLNKLLSFLSTSSWQTVLSSVDLNIIRLLNSIVTNQTAFSTVDLLINRLLTSVAAGQTVLSSIDLLNLISFISTAAIQTVLLNIDLDKLLSFLSTATTTTTLSSIDLDKLLSLLSASNIVSVFSSIDLLVAGFIDFLSTANVVTTLSSIDLNRVMLLLSTALGQSILSPADLNVTRLLNSTVINQTDFTTIDLLINRLLTSTAVGQTTLSSIDLTRLMNIVSVVSTQTTLSSIDVNVLISLLSTAGITSDLSSAQLSVLRNILSTANIVTLLSTIVLLSGTIENIITTSIKDASTSYIVKDLTKNMMNIKQLLTYTITDKSDILDALYSLGSQSKVIGASSYNITNKSDVLSIREISQEE